ncbi:MAG TPA: class I SAM-dependent methyltransferase [Pirellulales bacterium]|jgi:SAM-dependent methyltransferase|nr:class I SAM-dependent methyltransferase [Pirellulales bacterium]
MTEQDQRPNACVVTGPGVSSPADAGSTRYDNDFFDRLEEGSLASAAVIVPILVGWLKPSSVVDVGCGRGAWLSVFKEQGVERVLGIDGPYIDRKQLLIPEPSFLPADLAAMPKLAQRFDLAICLEVAEHLSWRHAEQLVAGLASLAPFVLFSAAVPGQSGVNHVNAQWPLYWVGLFSDHGLRCLDIVRPRIWRNGQVNFFYRQNIFLFASEAGLSDRPDLLNEEAFGFDDLQLIHAGIFGQFQGVRGLLGHLPGAIRRAITNRITRHRRRS